MRNQQVIIKTALVLLCVWACVWAVRSYAGSKKITAESVNRAIEEAKFSDWSEETSAPSPAEAKRREKELEKVAALVNRLDFQEREKNRANRAGEDFFKKLSPAEKGRFIDLTVMESMKNFMESLDTMKPEQRKNFVEQGLREIKEGRTGADMARADELDPNLLEKISQQGMRAYFDSASADTKLDLAPLMEAMNETMQGLRGNEFGPRP
ncbi:MAG: hypothetical protein HC845_10480 [Akkermansiaceae bacterium]|nr:hypothetical protein [Akkermansiaceae bacterium]